MKRSIRVFLGLAALAVTASAREYDQEKQNRDATCDNGCFFGSFPGGSCTDDAACLCNRQEYRERYYCCMAEKCHPDVLEDGIPRHFLACEAHNVPIPEDFDTQGVCGIELSSASSGAAAASTSAAASGSGSSPSSTSSAAETSTTAEPSATGECSDIEDRSDDDDSGDVEDCWDDEDSADDEESSSAEESSEDDDSLAGKLNSVSAFGLGAVVVGFGLLL